MDLHPLAALERLPENRIIVDDDIEANHVLIRESRRAWSAARSAQPSSAKIPRLDITVSRDGLPRALRIMQALLMAFEHRGYAVQTTAEACSTVTILEQPVRFRMDEREQQVRHEPTKAELEAARRGPPLRRWDQAPTGRLALKIVRPWAAGRRVADRASTRLEDRLNEFMELLVAQALVQQAEHAKAEEERRRREETERRQREAAAREREEQARINGFEHLVAAWSRTQARRACLSRLRRAAGRVDAHTEMGRWLQWIEEYIDQNDPVGRVEDREDTITVHYALTALQN